MHISRDFVSCESGSKNFVGQTLAKGEASEYQKNDQQSPPLHEYPNLDADCAEDHEMEGSEHSQTRAPRAWGNLLWFHKHMKKHSDTGRLRHERRN